MAANWGLADPNAFSRQITNHLATPQEKQAQVMNVLAQQQQMELHGQQIQQNKLALKSQQLQVGDQEAVRGAWQQAQGDGNKFLENLKVSAPHLYDKARLEMAGRAAEETAKAIAPLNSLHPEQRAQAWPQVRQRLIQMGHNPQSEPALMSDQYPGDQWVALNMGQVMDVKDQVAAQQKVADLKQKTTKDNADIAHQKAQESIGWAGVKNARDANSVNADLKTLKAKELQNTLNQQTVANDGAIDAITKTIDSVDRLGKHEGLSAAVGMKNPFGGAFGDMSVPGSRSADFKAELDTLKAQTFLPQVKEMKGMGALSDAEGKKLTDAIGALSSNMSEKAFRESLVRIREGLERGKNRAIMLKQLNGPISGQQQQAQPQAANEPTAVGPGGHQIVFRNGAWVDAQSGQPLQ